MAEVIQWPGNILKPQNVMCDIAHRSLAGPSATNGYTQITSNSAGIWQVKYTGIPIYNAQMIKLWRALDVLIEGRLNVISLPVWDYPRSPSSTSDDGTNLYNFYKKFVPHSDTSFYSDGSGYQSTYTNVVISASAAVGTVTLSVVKAAPLVTLEPGHRFSINDRLYEIRKISAQTSTTATFTVRPPIREAIAIGDRLEFDNPRVKVRLTSDTAMQITLDNNRRVFPDLDFIEETR